MKKDIMVSLIFAGSVMMAAAALFVGAIKDELRTELEICQYKDKVLKEQGTLIEMLEGRVEWFGARI